MYTYTIIEKPLSQKEKVKDIISDILAVAIERSKSIKVSEILMDWIQEIES